MTSLTLHHFPGACSQVTLCALEASSLPYALELVNLSANAQGEPAYLAKSPLGKVPALETDEGVLTENAALLVYIAALAPDARLFPAAQNPRAAAQIQAGLSFCGGTLHPIVRGLVNPSRLTTGDEAGVRERSAELAEKSFGYANSRLEETGWWLGDRSIIDVYLNWAASVARRGGYDIEAFPAIARLADALTEWPAYVRMIEIEEQSRKQLGL